MPEAQEVIDLASDEEAAAAGLAGPRQEGGDEDAELRAALALSMECAAVEPPPPAAPVAAPGAAALVAMGFGAVAVEKALRAAGGNVDLAAARLLDGVSVATR